MSTRTARFVPGGVTLLVVAALMLDAGPAAARPARPVTAPQPARAAWPRDGARHETAFITDINRVRAARGLPRLRVHPDLTRKSRHWAALMAAARKVWHSRISAGVTANWQKLGENVGMGHSEAQLHAAFVASGTHLANLIDPAFRYIGVGVVVSDGILYVSQVFMQPPTRVRRRTAASDRTTGQRIRPQALRPPPAPASPTPRAGRHFRPLS